MAKLVLNAGTPQAQEFHLKPGKNFIGRGFANDFKLDDASVSGSHAVFAMDGSTVTVTDLGSTNGTRINQLPATGNPLQTGQVVRLGGVELLFVADASPSPAAPGIPPPPTAASKIATEFFIREPSHIGVASAAPPPPPPPAAAPAPVPVSALKIPGATPPVPAPVTAASAPIATASAPATLAPPPPTPILIPSAPGPALRIPTATPSAPVPVASAPVAPPAPAMAPSPQLIFAPAPPPPPPTFAAAAAEAPPVAGGGRLTLAGSRAPAPATITIAPPPPDQSIAAAPPAPSIEGIEAPAGMVACKYHRNVSGQWLCQKCTQLFCALCVVTRPTPAGTGHFCRTCGTQCAPVKMKAVAKKKEKQLVAYSEGTILLRTLGFGFGGAVICGGIWAGFTALTAFDMPAIFAPLTGVGCGYAVKIASQDRPGGFFSLMAIVATLLGVLLGFFGAILITGHFLFTINSLAMGVFGVCLAFFVAWKVGGGDF
jgi:hypothetical protein